MIKIFQTNFSESPPTTVFTTQPRFDNNKNLEGKKAISIYHYHHLLVTHAQGRDYSAEDRICGLQLLLLHPLHMTNFILYSLTQSFGHLHSITN